MKNLLSLLSILIISVVACAASKNTYKITLCDGLVKQVPINQEDGKCKKVMEIENIGKLTNSELQELQRLCQPCKVTQDKWGSCPRCLFQDGGCEKVCGKKEPKSTTKKETKKETKSNVKAETKKKK